MLLEKRTILTGNDKLHGYVKPINRQNETSLLQVPSFIDSNVHHSPAPAVTCCNALLS